jgi:short-subunit dehydrogenase
MGKFDGQIVLITGASSGIGAELAKAFAHEGADLVLAARRVDRLDTLAQEIKNMGRRVLVAPCDVTQDGNLEDVIRQTHETLGVIDVVIANAGFGVSGKFEKLTLEDYRRQFETNVFGVLRTIYAALDDLKLKRGRIAIIGSVAGYLSTPQISAYSMSKFAIRALGETLALELRSHGISVTTINPGFVDTDIRKLDNQGQLKPQAKDPVPKWLMMPADKAAQKILQAVYRRKRERILTIHGQLLVWLNRFAPGLLRLFISTGRKPNTKHSKN